MSHWNLQVTIENRDKEVMRGRARLVVKWHFVDYKTPQWQKQVVIVEDSNQS